MPQPRRRPIGIGGGSRSISGDHTTLTAYGVPTSANAPIVLRLRPALANHADKVENVSSSGSPLAKPSGRMSITRRSVYSASERRQSPTPFAAPVTRSAAAMVISYHERDDPRRPRASMQAGIDTHCRRSKIGTQRMCFRLIDRDSTSDWAFSWLDLEGHVFEKCPALSGELDFSGQLRSVTRRASAERTAGTYVAFEFDSLCTYR